MLGNEVVFDSVQDFNVAMQSPLRHEMRAHFHTFPKFSGAVTHFPCCASDRWIRELAPVGTIAPASEKF